MTNSKPQIGELIQLVTAMQRLGAVRVVLGDFECILEPRPVGMFEPEAEPEDELLADKRSAANHRKRQAQDAMAAQDAKEKRKAIERELYGASEST